MSEMDGTTKSTATGRTEATEPTDTTGASGTTEPAGTTATPAQTESFVLGACATCGRGIVFASGSATAECPDCHRVQSYDGTRPATPLAWEPEPLDAEALAGLTELTARVQAALATPQPAPADEGIVVPLDAVEVMNEARTVFYDPADVKHQVNTMTERQLSIMVDAGLKYLPDVQISASHTLGAIDTMHSFQVVRTTTGAVLTSWVGASPFVLFALEGEKAEDDAKTLDLLVEVLVGLAGLILGVRLGKPASKAFGKLAAKLLKDKRFRELFDDFVKALIGAIPGKQFREPALKLWELLKYLFKKYPKDFGEALKEAATGILSACNIVATLAKWTARLFTGGASLIAELIILVGGLAWKLAR